MKELEKIELIDTNGGVFGFDDFLLGCAIGAVIAIINDWDNFERGIKGEPCKTK